MEARKQAIFIIILCLFCSSQMYSKVLIFTYVFNQPEFLEIQYKTLKKFLLDDYELVVFNDAIDKKIENEINIICKKYHLRNIPIPQEIHERPYLDRPESGLFIDKNQASVRNANVVQYSLDVYGLESDSILALLDSDIFLTRDFSIEQYLGSADIAAWSKPCCDLGLPCQFLHPDTSSYSFLWIGLIFMNPKKMPHKESINFNCSYLKGAQADAGGYTYFYVDNPDIETKYFNRARLIETYCQYCVYRQRPCCNHNTHTLQNFGLDKQQISFAQSMPILYDSHWNRNIEFFLDGAFVHFRAGSNYLNIPADYVTKKMNILTNYINTILKN